MAYLLLSKFVSDNNTTTTTTTTTEATVDSEQSDFLQVEESGDDEDSVNLKFNNLYWSQWNVKDPSMRNFYVDPDTLEVRSQYWEHVTFIPLIATMILITTVFLLVLYRQSPTMIASTVAGCLTIVGIYLILNTIREGKIKYQ